MANSILNHATFLVVFVLYFYHLEIHSLDEDAKITKRVVEVAVVNGNAA